VPAPPKIPAVATRPPARGASPPPAAAGSGGNGSPGAAAPAPPATARTTAPLRAARPRPATTGDSRPKPVTQPPRPSAARPAVEGDEPARGVGLAVIAGGVVISGLIVFFLLRGRDGNDRPPRPLASTPVDAGVPHPLGPPVDAAARISPPPVAIDAGRVEAPPVDAASTSPPRPTVDAGAAPPRDEYTQRYDEARAAHRRGRLDEALDKIDDALELKRTARALELKADILVDMGDTGAALVLLDNALGMSSSAGLWKKKGWAHYKMRDYDAAKAAFTAYLEKAPRARDAEMIRNLIGENP
jgi:hypothetical protein